MVVTGLLLLIFHNFTVYRSDTTTTCYEFAVYLAIVLLSISLQTHLIKSLLVSKYKVKQDEGQGVTSHTVSKLLVGTSTRAHNKFPRSNALFLLGMRRDICSQWRSMLI
jgi:hypothetical protein